MKRETLVIPLGHDLAVHLERCGESVLLWLYQSIVSEVLFLRSDATEVAIRRQSSLCNLRADLWIGDGAIVPLPVEHTQAVADFLGLTIEAAP